MAAHPPVDPQTAPPSSPATRKVLLIGWDAADWKVIHPLLDAGKMPHLARLLEQGVMGNISTLQPALSPTLWTSIATGKRPYKHGILGFSEPDPVTGGIRPITNLSRKTKAIWNILNQKGKNTITVGWWPSNPAEPLSHGVMVSDHYQKSHGPPEPWPLKPGSIHPQRLEPHLVPLRFHPSELTDEDLRPFLPGLDGLPREDLDKAEKDPRVQSLMKIIADCTSIHSAATALIQNEPWDLMCVYYDAIDHFGHAFMKYHPPQRPQVDDWDFRVFHHCVEMGYRYHDAMLGTLLHLAGDDATVILMSDHGFHPDDLRLGSIPREPAGPAAEHRQFGIFAAKGSGIRRDQRIDGASIIDICPTLLHLFGLPVGDDMDGKVLTDLFETPPETIERIASWDEVPGDHGMHPADTQISAADSKAALRQLIDLGYIDEPDADHSTAIEHTVRELDYNLAQAWIDGGHFGEAVGILERLYDTWPMEHRFGFKLATCYQNQGRPHELRALVRTVRERRMQEASEAAEALRELQLEDEEKRREESTRIAAMSEQELEKFHRERHLLLAKARPNLFSLGYLEAFADVTEKRYLDALAKLQDLDHDFGARRAALTLRGEVLQLLHRWDESRIAFAEALAIDPETPAASLGIARADLAMRDFPQAIHHARKSLGLVYFQPKGHYILGLAHYRLGELEEAKKAFLTCARQAPLFASAFRMLGQIARLEHDAPGQTEYALRLRHSRERLAAVQATKHADLRQLNSRPLHSGDDPASRPMPELHPRPETLAAIPPTEIITIVSGLPRSGTSLMMQVLEAAGLPAFTDGRRQADDSNQKGYYEHDQVAALLSASEKSWLTDARGHALKVVAPLLSSLPLALPNDPSHPGKLHYRVLFMERDMEEVVRSQESMLTRLGKPRHPEADIARAYRQQVHHAKSWLQTRGIPAVSVSYHDLVHHPEEVLPTLADFLGRSDRIEPMRAVIDPSLHRARSTPIAQAVDETG
ncbi:MAG: tetratricopeptide repeat protein [Verrucomicrobia bacterium]|nr:MAG: tetratricopeptide repeat protein [Verrucomicrobiota bacterium]TAE86280.1 MAG: tetratricopeptide repeat protein [Verrucomicrobiota bacterium]TAF23052.1 MAG: tetratricopeptide repeat protein [Verrucomicrobiota bacterium]TAF39943.1 MAG: tetratricopeptide repeat protein [Verrucomicrobiota bacterium]